jgi:RsiW-degrading membrane proteinase PrsW (M82 family)
VKDINLLSVFCMQMSSFPKTVAEAVFSSSYVLGTFVKIQVGVAGWIHIWVFYPVPLIFISVFMPVSCCFYCSDSAV